MGGTDRTENSERYASCVSGEDAQSNPDCARQAVEISLRSFWSETLGSDFRPVDQVLTFTGSVDTQCGGATAEVGPFYCPADQSIYLDTSFFEDVLEEQLGGPGGEFVEPYVLAHEYGHHISNLTGQMGEVKSGTGPQSDGVRLELQADCYAGLWAAHATKTEDEDGQVLITDITEQDMQEALDAARTVGDNRIQKKSGQRVDEEVWTHGSDEQRARWFSTGYEADGMDACDTFAASTV